MQADGYEERLAETIEDDADGSIELQHEASQASQNRISSSRAIVISAVSARVTQVVVVVGVCDARLAMPRMIRAVACWDGVENNFCNLTLSLRDSVGTFVSCRGTGGM